MRKFAFIVCALFLVSILAGCSNVALGASTPEQVAEAFVKASTNRDGQEVLKLILDPDSYKHLAGSTKNSNPQTIQFTYAKARSKNVPTDKYVIVDLLIQGQQNPNQVYLKNTEHGLKVDVPRTLGIGPESFTQFKVDKPVQPVQFYVYAKLDDYYNYEFRGMDNQNYSLALYDNQGQYASIHAYLPKQTQDAQKAYDLLKDGQIHQMVVALSYPVPFLRQEGSDGVFLNQVICAGDWLDVPASERSDGSQ